MAEEGGVYNRQRAYRRSNRAAEDHYDSMEEGEGEEIGHICRNVFRNDYQNAGHLCCTAKCLPLSTLCPACEQMPAMLPFLQSLMSLDTPTLRKLAIPLANCSTRMCLVNSPRLAPTRRHEPIHACIMFHRGMYVWPCQVTPLCLHARSTLGMAKLRGTRRGRRVRGGAPVPSESMLVLGAMVH